MRNSPLRDKSEMLVAAGDLLCNNGYYAAAAHAAYYSCHQMLKCIWMNSMGKSDDELGVDMSQSQRGSHEYLLNCVVTFISSKPTAYSDVRQLRSEILQFKKLRVDADYSDTIFDSEKGRNAIELSKRLMPILKKY